LAGMFVSLVIASPPVPAAVSKASLKCRATIAKKAAAARPPGLIKKGLSALDACHAKRDKRGSAGDCNAVDLSALASRFAAAVNRACGPDDTVRLNYLNKEPAAEVMRAVTTALAASGAAVQGAPDIG